MKLRSAFGNGLHPFARLYCKASTCIYEIAEIDGYYVLYRCDFAEDVEVSRVDADADFDDNYLYILTSHMSDPVANLFEVLITV